MTDRTAIQDTLTRLGRWAELSSGEVASLMERVAAFVATQERFPAAAHPEPRGTHE